MVSEPPMFRIHSLKAPLLPASGGRADGKADIGRLEIKWRRSMGEVRLTRSLFGFVLRCGHESR